MNIAIIGLGLIGGSIALALRAAKPDTNIIAFDRDEMQLDLALRAGAIDVATADFAAIASADVIFICVPVAQASGVFAALKPHLRGASVLTDVGSTKQSAIAAACVQLGSEISCFVPGHPIAGREHSGFAAAASELFEGKNVVLTPLAENSKDTVEIVRSLWHSCGARVMEMSAKSHDEIFAAVSHLPHLLAFALVDEFATRPNAKDLFTFAASGFRDFTRIASSSPEMWRDIALDNCDALLDEIDRYMLHASELRAALVARDGQAIEALMTRARDARERWIAGEFDRFRDESA
jgi:prephenate dehydrogenase